MKQPEQIGQNCDAQSIKGLQEAKPSWAETPFSPIDNLLLMPLDDSLKAYLAQLMENAAVCGLAGSAVLEAHHQVSELRRLCDILAAMKRVLDFAEQRFLFNYLHDAVADGYDIDEIGFNDAVLAKLVVDKFPQDLSELEVQPMLAHNQEIFEFLKKCEPGRGFYELTAAKLVQCEPVFLQALNERCFALLNTESPRGVMFALALLNLRQVKTSVKLLTELAKYGQITMLTSFLHRLLGIANGAEVMIFGLLKLNLRRQGELFSYQKEYTTRCYLSAVRSFSEAGFYKQAADLLVELTIGGWFDGAVGVKKDIAARADEILNYDHGLQDVLEPVLSFLYPNFSSVQKDYRQKELQNEDDLLGFDSVAGSFADDEIDTIHLLPVDYTAFGLAGSFSADIDNEDEAAEPDTQTLEPVEDKQPAADKDFSLPASLTQTVVPDVDIAALLEEPVSIEARAEGQGALNTPVEEDEMPDIDMLTSYRAEDHFAPDIGVVRKIVPLTAAPGERQEPSATSAVESSLDAEFSEAKLFAPPEDDESVSPHTVDFSPAAEISFSEQPVETQLNIPSAEVSVSSYQSQDVMQPMPAEELEAAAEIVSWEDNGNTASDLEEEAAPAGGSEFKGLKSVSSGEIDSYLERIKKAAVARTEEIKKQVKNADLSNAKSVSAIRRLTGSLFKKK